MTFPAVCPIADRYEWLPQRNIGGAMPTTRGLVFHVNAGDGDPYGWWTQPSTPIASSHFQLMKSGELIQYVRLDTVAWCQVAGSSTWHSIETEGWPNEPLTPAAVAKFAKLYAWGHANLGWPLQTADSPSGSGLGWHGMGGYAWGGHFNCCGDDRKAQREQILQLATGGDFTMDAEARERFDELLATMQQLVTVIQGVPEGKPNPFGLVGTRDLQAGIHQLVTVVQGVPKGEPNPFGLVGTSDLQKQIATVQADVKAVKAAK